MGRFFGGLNMKKQPDWSLPEPSVAGSLPVAILHAAHHCSIHLDIHHKQGQGKLDNWPFRKGSKITVRARAGSAALVTLPVYSETQIYLGVN